MNLDRTRFQDLAGSTLWTLKSVDKGEAGLRAVLLDTTTGRQVPLDLPERMRGAYADPWGWSSPDVLMIELMTTDGPDDTEVDPELWACRVSAGTCESLPDAAPVLPW